MQYFSFYCTAKKIGSIELAYTIIIMAHRPCRLPATIHHFNLVAWIKVGVGSLTTFQPKHLIASKTC